MLIPPPLTWLACSCARCVVCCCFHEPTRVISLIAKLADSHHNLSWAFFHIHCHCERRADLRYYIGAALHSPEKCAKFFRNLATLAVDLLAQCVCWRDQAKAVGHVPSVFCAKNSWLKHFWHHEARYKRPPDRHFDFTKYQSNTQKLHDHQMPFIKWKKRFANARARDSSSLSNSNEALVSISSFCWFLSRRRKRAECWNRNIIWIIHHKIAGELKFALHKFSTLALTLSCKPH